MCERAAYSCSEEETPEPMDSTVLMHAEYEPVRAWYRVRCHAQLWAGRAANTGQLARATSSPWMKSCLAWKAESLSKDILEYSDMMMLLLILMLSILGVGGGTSGSRWQRPRPLRAAASLARRP